MKNLISKCWIIESNHFKVETTIYLHKPEAGRNETVYEYETVFHARKIIRQQHGSEVAVEVFGLKSHRELMRGAAEYEALWHS